MSDSKESRLRRASPELIAVLGLGLTILLAVLGQAVWLDGKIERGDARLAAQIERVDTKLTSKIDSADARLSARIEGLHAGQADIRERLVAIEAQYGRAGSPTANNKGPQDSSL